MVPRLCVWSDFTLFEIGKLFTFCTFCVFSVYIQFHFHYSRYMLNFTLHILRTHTVSHCVSSILNIVPTVNKQKHHESRIFSVHKISICIFSVYLTFFPLILNIGKNFSHVLCGGSKMNLNILNEIIFFSKFNGALLQHFNFGSKVNQKQILYCFSSISSDYTWNEIQI